MALGQDLEKKMHVPSKESKQMASEMPGFNDQVRLHSAVTINVLFTSRLDSSPTQTMGHTERKECPLSFGTGPSYKSAK